MNHGGSAVSKERGTSAPPSIGEKMWMCDTEGASGRASESVDDRRSRGMSATEGRDDEWMIRPISERDD